jgi:predicted RNase H-like HicB family nuclease
VPALPEIVTYGADEAEAPAMAKAAIELAVEPRLDRREPVPKSGTMPVREVVVAVPTTA